MLLLLLAAIASAGEPDCKVDGPIGIRRLKELFQNCEFQAGTSIIFPVVELGLAEDGSTPLPTMSDSNRKTLETIIQMLSIRPELGVLVVGNADPSDVGDHVEISISRAISVAEYIATRGIDRKRVLVEGAGSTNPIDTSGSKRAVALNRRVEFVVFQLGK